MALTSSEKTKRYLERHPERRAAYEATDRYKKMAAAVMERAISYIKESENF